VLTVRVLPPVTADVGTVMPVFTANVMVFAPEVLSTENSNEVPRLTAPPSCVAMAAAVGKVIVVTAALVEVM
jgi:hypothetical protein